MTTPPVLAIATALLLVTSAAGVQAQQAPGPGGPGPGQAQQQMGPGMGRMGMDPAMMQRLMQLQEGAMPRAPRMLGQGMPGPAMRGTMLRLVFALMDADGDGEVSREEFRDAHDRIFNHMDADGSGALTLEELLAFVHGPQRQRDDGPDD